MTVSRTQNTTSKTSSKHEEANEAPGQDSESCLSIDGGHRSKDKIESHGDTRTIELDTASVSRDIENSILDNKHQAIAATHDGIESALPPQNHAVCLSSGCGPRCEPQAHDVRPLSAQMPIIPPHKDPLDDILERLRIDSHTNVAGGDPASHATSRDRNFPVSEEARVPDTVQEHSRMPPHAFVNNIYAPEAPVSASKSSRKPCSASLRLASAHDGSRSSQTLSRGSLHSSNRPGIDYAKGYPLIRPQSQVDSRNAWNDYENLYERQQEQADLTPENLREHRPPYTAREDLSSLLRETDHAAAPDEYAQIIHPVDSGGESDDYMPYMYKMLQEENDDGNYQGIRHSERDDQFVDYVACYDPRASRFDESHEGCNDGIMAETNVNDYQQRGTNADHEHSFAQGAVQYEPEPQLFTTNITDTYSSWRPRDIFGGNYGLERCAADAQVHDVNPALSRFWAPHKLY